MADRSVHVQRRIGNDRALARQGTRTLNGQSECSDVSLRVTRSVLTRTTSVHPFDTALGVRDNWPLAGFNEAERERTPQCVISVLSAAAGRPSWPHAYRL